MFGLLLLSFTAGTAFAGFSTVPEPGVIELLGIGGVAALAIAIRKRRK
jgi:hypothetical protein